MVLPGVGINVTMSATINVLIDVFINVFIKARARGSRNTERMPAIAGMWFTFGPKQTIVRLRTLADLLVRRPSTPDTIPPRAAGVLPIACRQALIRQAPLPTDAH